MLVIRHNQGWTCLKKQMEKTLIRLFHPKQSNLGLSCSSELLWQEFEEATVNNFRIIYPDKHFFSSPEPKAQGELIVWDSSRRLSVHASVRPHFQT